MSAMRRSAMRRSAMRRSAMRRSAMRRSAMRRSAMRRSFLLFVVWSAAFGLLWGGCTPPSETSSEAAVETVEEPKTGLEIVLPRVLVTPGGGSAAVYLSVQNHDDLADRLVAVESSIAQVAEIHESVDDDGVMRMVAHPDGFEVPASGVLELLPGGKHVMLIEPEIADDTATVPMMLRFERAGEVEVEADLLRFTHPVNRGETDPAALAHGDHGTMDHGSMDHGDHDTMDHGDHDTMDHGTSEAEGQEAADG